MNVIPSIIVDATLQHSMLAQNWAGNYTKIMYKWTIFQSVT